MNRYYPETASSQSVSQWEAASVASHCSAVSNDEQRHRSLADQITQPEQLAYILSINREELYYDPQQQFRTQPLIEAYKPAAVYRIAEEFEWSRRRSFWAVPAQIATMLCIAVVATMTILMLALTIGPRFFPYQVYSVLSGSMEPTLHVGAVAIVLPVTADQLRVGDIITFAHPERKETLVTHRIYEMKDDDKERVITTKGDANNAPDGWAIIAPDSASGWRYAFTIPYAGYLLAWFQSPLGRILVLGVPCFAFAVVALIDIWKPKKTDAVGV